MRGFTVCPSEKKTASTGSNSNPNHYFTPFSYSETDNRSDIRDPDLDHAFTDELLQKIESLTNDKSELSQALEEAKIQELKLNQKLEASRQSTLLASIETTKGSKNR